MTTLKNTICPWCGKRHQLVSAIAEKGVTKEPVPEDGDATLCVGCGEIALFDHSVKGGLRFPTESESAELAQMHLVQKLRMTYRDIPHRFSRPVLNVPQWMKVRST